MTIYSFIDILIKLSVIQFAILIVIRLLDRYSSTIKYQLMRIGILLMLVLPIASVYFDVSLISIFDIHQKGSAHFNLDIYS